MSIECAYGLAAVRAHNQPLPKIPPERRVSLDQFRDR